MSNTDYVTKPVAIAMKAAGFDEMALFVYINNRVLSYQTGGARNSDFQNSTVVPAWTAAAKWLYDKSGKSIHLSLNADLTADKTLIENEGVKTKHFHNYESAFLAAVGMIKTKENE